MIKELNPKINTLNELIPQAISIISDEVEDTTISDINDFDKKSEDLENNINNENNKEKAPKEDDENPNKSVFKTIDDLTNEVVTNENIGEEIIKKYKEYSKLNKSLIKIIFDYKKESEIRSYDSKEYTGKIKIAFRPQDIGTFYEKLINLEFENLKKGDIEFIPGFQYINKEVLEEFKKNLKEGEIQLKTANIITKMVAYLENMLNRVLDMVFLSIQKYLYDRLTDDKMISFLRNGIHLLSFEKCKNLIEIKPEDIEKREECQRKITDLQKALNEISKINNNIIINDYEDELYEEEKQ